MEKIRVFTAFSGYDSQCLALNRLGVKYDLVGWSEIDRYAIKAHNVLFPQYAERNYGDISKIDWYEVPDFDLFTYSFPCTDISTAGKQSGLAENSGTRSSLLWECKKAIETKRPKFLLLENVKALVSEKFISYLHTWLDYLARLGYNNHTKVLNATEYGVPQNRERVFVVSILGTSHYYWPQPQPLTKTIAAVLEKDVDPFYFLSEKSVQQVFKHDNMITKEPYSGKTKTITTEPRKMRYTQTYIAQ